MTGGLLLAAAERWGTPIYVTDLDAAAASAGAWSDVLPRDSLVAYAVKANPDPALLNRLAGHRIGAEVVGSVELALARRAGMPPDRIVVNGVGATDADLAEAAASGALVNAESLGAVAALVAAGAPRIGLRINPAVDAATHPHLVTGAADAKFGIALDELPAAIDAIRAAGLPVESIGAHIGSAIGEVAPFARTASLLRELAEAHGIGTIDMGGGFDGSPVAWASAVLPAVGRGRLIVEPGRSVVADAGWLVTRVVRVQARGHLVTDAGMTELLRPMLYGAEHPVSVLEAGPAPIRRAWTVAGPVCEAGDLLTRDVELEAGPGALLAVGEAGAYGAAMASNYNGRLRPAQAVIEGGQLRLSRRRETLEDLVARDVNEHPER